MATLAPVPAPARKPSLGIENAVNGTLDPAVAREILLAGILIGVEREKARARQARALARLRRKPDNVLSIVGRLQERAAGEIADDDPMVGESV